MPCLSVYTCDAAVWINMTVSELVVVSQCVRVRVRVCVVGGIDVTHRATHVLGLCG